MEGKGLVIRPRLHWLSAFHAALKCLFFCSLSSILIAQEASFQTQSGAHFTFSVEPGRIYQAQFSTDLENWTPLGDRFLPSVRTPWIFPDQESGFVQLIPDLHLEDIELRVVIVGDSTVADLSGLSIQLHGWGQVMADFFQPDVLLSNQAGTGVGTERFLERSLIDRVQRVNPHAVLMQLGHIDDDRELPEDVYEENLKTIVEQVRSIGAIPILITPVARRLFDFSDNVVNVLADRRASILEVAAEERVTLIDLNQKSVELFQEYGHDQTTFITVCGAQCDDQSHFSWTGSYVIAALAAEGFPPLLQAFRRPLSDVTDAVVAAFENDRKFESLSQPFVDLTGFDDHEIWDWVFWETPPLLP